MAQVLVRNLDESVVNRLKTRAKANGRSLQGEVKMILEQNAKMDRQTFWEVTERISKELEATGRTFNDSTELISKMRDPDA